MHPSQARHAALTLLLIGGGAAIAAEYPIAGTEPGQRPPEAPRIQAVDHSGAWYQQALHGISRPYPFSLRFLEDQGNWHTPFNRPGLTGRYDIRGWHQQ